MGLLESGTGIVHVGQESDLGTASPPVETAAATWPVYNKDIIMNVKYSIYNKL